jgi:hypothetical protein
VFLSEINEYKIDLEMSDTKEDLLTLKKLNSSAYKGEYTDKLLILYLERCKFIQALAFLQFRKVLPDAKLSDLMEIFNDRK